MQSRLDNLFLELRLKHQAVVDRIELPAIITKSGVSVSKSTVDYTGHFRGFPVAFDAKECKDKRLNFKSHLREHQIEYLYYWKTSCITQAKCFAGFLIQFQEIDKDHLYFLEILCLKSMLNDNIKSIEINDSAFLKFDFNSTFLEEYFAK